ncbi:MAG: ABC transporter permease subunit [Caldilineaceae bacterium]
MTSIVGVAAGIYVAPRQYGAADNILSVIAFILTSVPRFFLALVILYVLVFTFDQHHLTSFFSPEYSVAPWSFAKFLDLLSHIWPVIVIAGLGGVAQYARHNGNLLDVLNAQCVTSPLKGLREQRDESPRRTQCAASHDCLSRHRAALYGAGQTKQPL